jgi:hypothetical protein
MKQMDDTKGMDYLRRKLATKRVRVQLRYRYYEQKVTPRSPSKLLTETQKSAYASCLGWCAKAVDFLADRLVVSGFDNDNFDLAGIYNQNNPDILFDSAILSALISSCSFLYLSCDETGFPKMQVIDGGNATGILDPVTSMLKEGYAVLTRDPDSDRPTLEAYFLPGSTTFYPAGEASYTVDNAAPWPLLVPIINRPDAARPFGHSQISRACMDSQDKAAETITRTEVGADYYSVPQKYILGLSEDAEPMDKDKASISSFLQFTKDDEGGSPTLGQFAQASMDPNINLFRMHAAVFGGASGLTMDDLGFVSENPSSAEAIKAGHEALRNTARKAQRTFGTGFLNAGYLAACLRDDYPYLRRQLYRTRVRWDPIIEPDAAMLSSIGDGALKINQAVEGYMGKDNLEKLTGIRSEGEM